MPIQPGIGRVDPSPMRRLTCRPPMTASSSPAISSSHRRSSPRSSKARSSKARLRRAGSSGLSSRAGSSGPSSRLSPSHSRCCRRTWSRSRRRMSLVTTETRGPNRRRSPHRNRRHASSSLKLGRHRDRRALTGRGTVRLPPNRDRLRPPSSGLPHQERLHLERLCQGRLCQVRLHQGRLHQGRPDRCRSGPLASGPDRTGPCAFDLDRSTAQVRPELPRRQRRKRRGQGRPDFRASARPRT